MNHSHSQALSPSLLAQAPHRLMFFIGSTNLMLAMAWWAAWLAATRWPELWAMPQAGPYAGWLHAFVMQYQMLPSFIFGFLLTTFPRWLGLPDVSRWRFVPIGIGVFGGQIATLLGAMGWEVGIVVGLLMTLAGWTTVLVTLGQLLRRDRARVWHARMCYTGLSLGMVGLLSWTAFVLGAPATWAFVSIKIGTFGLLLTVYLSVAHRMFPFFAGNVVRGYKPWRPLWALGCLFGLGMGHLVLELLHAAAWLWLVDAPLLALTTLLWWRWWPRGPKPPILTVLFVGLAWLPIAFAMYTAQSVAYLTTDVLWLGRAPAHALFIGFFGSILVAMVTRVSQGHSGRPLTMPAVAWFAYVSIQAVTIMRVIAELAPDPMSWHAYAGLGWIVALAPWVARLGWIYLSPRVDGKPG